MLPDTRYLSTLSLAALLPLLLLLSPLFLSQSASAAGGGEPIKKKPGAVTVGDMYKDKEKANYTVTDEVWFEVEVKDHEGLGNHFRGRFVIGVFGLTAPMTAMNFVNIAKGYKRGKTILHYKNSPIHRIVKDFVVQMGDVTAGDGTGGTSIYGEKFNDENFLLSHRAPGMVSMANKGRDTNGSQFFITMVKARWMDGKHVVFGKVVKGFDVVKTVNEVETLEESSWPARKVKIVDCGYNEVSKRYELTDDQLDSQNDIDV